MTDHRARTKRMWAVFEPNRRPALAADSRHTAGVMLKEFPAGSFIQIGTFVYENPKVRGRKKALDQEGKK